MYLYKVLGALNVKVNLVIRVTLFVYTALLEKFAGEEINLKSAKEEYDSNAKYSFTVLRLYDRLLRWNNFTLWGVTSDSHQHFFDLDVSKVHLDIGVGSGKLVGDIEGELTAQTSFLADRPDYFPPFSLPIPSAFESFADETVPDFTFGMSTLRPSSMPPFKLKRPSIRKSISLLELLTLVTNQMN